MKSLLTICVAAAIALLAVAPMPASANITLAQQKQDFQPNNNGHPDTIGSGTWHYMYSNNINPTAGTTGLMQWVDWGYAVGPGDDYPDIEMHALGLTMAPEVGGAAATRYGVMRWTSGVTGPVNVTGTWTHYWSMGDGMDIAVYANGVQKFSTFLTTGSANFDFDITVSPGYVVDYVVGPGPLNNGNYDRAYIETTITLVPAPGAILLGSIGVGLVGWLRRNRSL